MAVVKNLDETLSQNLLSFYTEQKLGFNLEKPSSHKLNEMWYALDDRNTWQESFMKKKKNRWKRAGGVAVTIFAWLNKSFSEAVIKRYNFGTTAISGKRRTFEV